MDTKRPILLVDDIQPARETLINILKVLGYKNFLEASNGEEAKNILEEHNDIQLIISDWKMPRLSGIELLKWVRSKEKFRDIPFIMVTSKGEKEDIALAAEEEVTEYLVKPVTVEAVISKLEKIKEKTAQKLKLDNWLNHIKKLITEGKEDDVSNELEEMIEKHPQHKLRIMYEVAKLYALNKKLDLAEELIGKCLLENPLFTKGWSLKSDISLKKKNFNEALIALKKLYELNPNSSKTLHKIGSIYLEKGDFKRARDYFLMALNMSPDNTELIQNIWNSYLNRDLVDEVLRDFGPLLFEHLTIETLNNLAVSLSKKGLVEGAIRAYRQALKKDLNNAKIHYNIGIAYLKTGKKKLAMEHLTKAIEIDPSFEKAQKLLEKLLEEKKEEMDK